MIPQRIDNLLPENLDASLAQIPPPVMGFIYSDGRRECRSYLSLEDVYLEFFILNTPILYFPDFLMMADGSILVYIHQLFYQAFSLKAYTEPELREMIDLSNLQNH